MLYRFRRRLLVLLPLPVLVVGLAACGGSSNDQNAKDLINKAFKQQIKSANVDLNVQATLNGLPTAGGPISIKLSGPYQNNGKGKLPSLDWKLAFTGAGRTFSAGVITTGDNAFINFRGQNYEVGTQTVQRLNQQLATQRRQRGTQSLQSLGINPNDWVENAKNEGDSTVAGVQTTHLSGTVDVGKLLDDLNNAVKKAPNVGGRLGSRAQLTNQQKDQVKKYVKNPTFDVYVGKDDNIVRRLSFDLKIDVPKDQSARLGGFSGGSLSFNLQFANVNQPVTITAPANAKPISDLTKQLGGLGVPGLSGIPGGSSSGGSSSGGSSSGGSSSGGSSTVPGGGSNSIPGGGSNSAQTQKFQKYLDCVRQARGDQAKIQACTSAIQ